MASNKKRKIRRRRGALVLCVILPVVIYAGVVFLRHYNQYQELCIEKEELAVKLEALSEESEQLKSDVAFTKTGEYVERMARELLGWVKSGEVKYVEKQGAGTVD